MTSAEACCWNETMLPVPVATLVPTVMTGRMIVPGLPEGPVKSARSLSWAAPPFAVWFVAMFRAVAPGVPPKSVVPSYEVTACMKFCEGLTWRRTVAFGRCNWHNAENCRVTVAGCLSRLSKRANPWMLHCSSRSRR